MVTESTEVAVLLVLNRITDQVGGVKEIRRMVDAEASFSIEKENYVGKKVRKPKRIPD